MSEPTERFDIVDEADNVIGSADRKTAHSMGHLHRVAAVFVFNQTGHLYIQEHSRDGKWDHSVGGHVHVGETYGNAASREMAEELGLVTPLTQVATGLGGPEYANERHLYGLYTCTAPEAWTFTPNAEVNTIIAMPLREVITAMQHEPETRFTRGFRITMHAYLAACGYENPHLVDLQVVLANTPTTGGTHA